MIIITTTTGAHPTLRYPELEEVAKEFGEYPTPKLYADTFCVRYQRWIDFSQQTGVSMNTSIMWPFRACGNSLVRIEWNPYRWSTMLVSHWAAGGTWSPAAICDIGWCFQKWNKIIEASAYFLSPGWSAVRMPTPAFGGLPTPLLID